MAVAQVIGLLLLLPAFIVAITRGIEPFFRHVEPKEDDRVRAAALHSSAFTAPAPPHFSPHSSSPRGATLTPVGCATRAQDNFVITDNVFSMSQVVLMLLGKHARAHACARARSRNALADAGYWYTWAPLTGIYLRLGLSPPPGRASSDVGSAPQRTAARRRCRSHIVAAPAQVSTPPQSTESLRPYADVALVRS